MGKPTKSARDQIIIAPTIYYKHIVQIEIGNELHNVWDKNIFFGLFGSVHHNFRFVIKLFMWVESTFSTLI